MQKTLAESASLQNHTKSVGWRPDESALLKTANIKYGICNWKEMINAKLFPHKTKIQMINQTQKLCGQRSLRGLKGMNLDIDKLHKDNSVKTGDEIQRKNKLIKGPDVRPST